MTVKKVQITRRKVELPFKIAGINTFWIPIAKKTLASYSYRVPINSVGIKDTFNEKDMAKYEKEWQKAIDALKSNEACRAYLALHEVDVDRLVEAVGLQRPFDGRNSKVSRSDAGVVHPSTDLSIEFQIRVANGSISGNFQGMQPFDAQTAIFCRP